MIVIMALYILYGEVYSSECVDLEKTRGLGGSWPLVEGEHLLC
jgi:hypothetical protein